MSNNLKKSREGILGYKHSNRVTACFTFFGNSFAFYFSKVNYFGL